MDTCCICVWVCLNAQDLDVSASVCACYSSDMPNATPPMRRHALVIPLFTVAQSGRTALALAQSNGKTDCIALLEAHARTHA